MKTPTRKLAAVAAVIAFTTGVSGYFMASLQVDRARADRSAQRSQGEAVETQDAPAGEILDAPRYADMRLRSHQPNHAWRSALTSLPPAPAFSRETTPLSADELSALLTKREARRAYNGAPPTVPHPIDQHDSASCMACHGRPTRIGNMDVPQLSHPIYTNCIQCHAPAAGPGAELSAPPPEQTRPKLANSFSGLAAPSNGTRAYQGSPPTLPHTIAMRQNCVSCHGPGGSSLIKTTHPERQNCLQCHALDASRSSQPVIVATH
jgi:nitrate reductase (cytochrome), electron transfer subunit